jgi:H-type lectin domain
MEKLMSHLKIPVWLIGLAGIVFIGIVLERLYVAKVSVKIWGLELNQPATAPLVPPTVLVGRFGADTNDGGWTLDTGSGQREFRRTIPFERTLKNPKVLVALSGIDADTNVGLRVSVSAQKVNATGFDLVFSSWAESRIFGVTGDWMAYGE